jgi:hypothetical protein
MIIDNACAIVKNWPRVGIFRKTLKEKGNVCPTNYTVHLFDSALVMKIAIESQARTRNEDTTAGVSYPARRLVTMVQVPAEC